jgi:hypothetical protein
MLGNKPEPTVEEQLIELLASMENRPYDFVMTMFPWGAANTELEKHTGPDPWQSNVLKDMQTQLLAGGDFGTILRVAIKSGHNVGKSALLAWIGWWAYSTRVDSKGRCTANTEKQLKTILWAELQKWFSLFLCKQFFKVTATSITSTDPNHPHWRFDAVPWSADNPDAFSGMHNFGNRVFVIYDEASGIDDSIWERTDGVTREAETQVIWVVASNPTKNFGRFYECFNKFAKSWLKFTISALDVRFTNKAELQQSIAEWGINDDYTKVRILGEFPSSSFSQLIPIESITSAQARQPVSWPNEPLILGVDVARFGDNENVAVFRRGRDAREVPAQRWRGLTVPETGARIAGLIASYQPDAVFIDEGGVGGGVVDYVRLLGHSVIGINFGQSAPSQPEGVLVANMRAYMYVMLQQWLRSGGVIELSETLKEQLISIEYGFTKQQAIQLMSKEDMRRLKRPSPDWADALALTFALPVSKSKWAGPTRIRRDYDPLSDKALDEFRTPAISNHDYRSFN